MQKPLLNRPARQSRRPDAYGLLILPLLGVVSFFYALPILRVLWLSVTDPRFGFHNYGMLVTNEGVRHAIVVTLRICTITSLLAVAIGYVVAYTMVHVGERQRVWISLFVLVPFWMSVLVRTFSWLTILRTEGVANSILIDSGIISQPLQLTRNEFGVILSITHYMIPYAVLTLYANMRGINPALMMASRSLGASAARTFRSVFLPLTRPGLVASGFLVFVLSLGFYVTPAVLGGGRVVMAAEYISVQILETMRWGLGAMMATTLMIVVVALFALISRSVATDRLMVEN